MQWKRELCPKVEVRTRLEGVLSADPNGANAQNRILARHCPAPQQHDRWYAGVSDLRQPEHIGATTSEHADEDWSPSQHAEPSSAGVPGPCNRTERAAGCEVKVSRLLPFCVVLDLHN